MACSSIHKMTGFEIQTGHIHDPTERTSIQPVSDKNKTRRKTLCLYYSVFDLVFAV